MKSETRNSISRCFLATLLLTSLFSVPTLGQDAESDAFSFDAATAFTLTVGFTANKEDKSYGDRTFSYFQLRGTIVNRNGEGFLHGADLECTAVDDTGFIVGYCAATDSDGDELPMMIQRVGSAGAEGGSDGDLLFLRGGGKYAGTMGGGTFAITFEVDGDPLNASGMMILAGQFRTP